jgi:hypothetical protein
MGRDKNVSETGFKRILNAPISILDVSEVTKGMVVAICIEVAQPTPFPCAVFGERGVIAQRIGTVAVCVSEIQGRNIDKSLGRFNHPKVGRWKCAMR